MRSRRDNRPTLLARWRHSRHCCRGWRPCRPHGCERRKRRNGCSGRRRFPVSLLPRRRSCTLIAAATRHSGRGGHVLAIFPPPLPVSRCHHRDCAYFRLVLHPQRIICVPRRWDRRNEGNIWNKCGERDDSSNGPMVEANMAVCLLLPSERRLLLSQQATTWQGACRVGSSRITRLMIEGEWKASVCGLDF